MMVKRPYVRKSYRKKAIKKTFTKKVQDIIHADDEKKFFEL